MCNKIYPQLSSSHNNLSYFHVLFLWMIRLNVHSPFFLQRGQRTFSPIGSGACHSSLEFLLCFLLLSSRFPVVSGKWSTRWKPLGAAGDLHSRLHHCERHAQLLPRLASPRSSNFNLAVLESVWAWLSFDQSGRTPCMTFQFHSVWNYGFCKVHHQSWRCWNGIRINIRAIVDPGVFWSADSRNIIGIYLLEHY